MPFDISTAKPAKKGFDINTAKSIEEEPAISEVSQTSLQTVKDVGMATAAIGIPAITGYKALKTYREPFRARNLALEPLRQAKTDLGITGRLRPEDLPKFVSSKIKASDIDLKAKLKEIDNLGMLSAEETSNVLMKQFPEWKQSGYQAYRKGLTSFEDLMTQSGKSFSPKSFNDDFIIKTIQDSIKEGVPETALTKLSKFSKDMARKKGYYTENLPFTQAKGNFNELVTELPVKAQYKMVENWGKFLENNAPPEILADFKSLQGNYKQFAEVRNRLSEMIDTDTGMLNPMKLNKYLYTSIKTKFDSGVKNLFDFLNKGNDIAKKMEGLSPSSDKLQALKIERNMVMAKVGEEINNLKQVLPKLEQQVLKAKGAQVRVDKRSLMGKIPYVKGTIKKGLPLLGVTTQILDAIKFSKDPTQYIAEQYGVGEERKRYKGGQMSDEEKLRLGLML